MKMNVNKIPVVLMLLAVINACGQTNKQLTIDNGQLSNEKNLKNGVVVSKIACNNDTTQSYAVYLPNAYSKENKYPVIYFFDPHAKGKIPVNKYKALAEKYSYVIIGSNNSKNGLELDKVIAIVQNLFDDSQNKIAIDKDKIYTAGFSGGARISGLICSSNRNIKGNIGCGAAFPITEDINSHKFDYIGFAGNTDFNLIEMKELDRALTDKPINHKLVIFEGKHEWPPENIFEETFKWLQNPQTITAQISTADEEIKEFKEKQKMQFYAANLRKNGIDWWKETVSKINSDIKQSKDKEDVLMNKRILNYLSLAAYMNASKSFDTGDIEKAKTALEIYSVIDPENSEPAYLFADVYMKDKNEKKALKYLQQAVKLGFDDYERISTDAMFAPLKENKDFKDILDKIKAKSKE